MKASVSEERIRPKKPVRIAIEDFLGTQKTLTHRDYFYSYIPIESESRKKEKPEKIAILWDASYSMRNRNLENELDVLGRYISSLQTVEVEYVSFNNTEVNHKKYIINNGNWEPLKKQIQSEIYDGGTQLGILDTSKIQSDEINSPNKT